MTIGYIHIRPGQTYSKENGLQGSPEPRGGVTVAYEHKDGVAGYGVAMCSSNDSYSRKLGRVVAKGRMDKFSRYSGSVVVEKEQTAPEAIISWLTECGVL